jgi:hypothetical protein
MGPTKNRLSMLRVAEDLRGFAPTILKPPKLEVRFFETMLLTLCRSRTRYYGSGIKTAKRFFEFS